MGMVRRDMDPEKEPLKNELITARPSKSDRSTAIFSTYSVNVSGWAPMDRLDAEVEGPYRLLTTEVTCCCSWVEDIVQSGSSG